MMKGFGRVLYLLPDVNFNGFILMRPHEGWLHWSWCHIKTLDSVESNESCPLADYIYCISFFSLHAIAITATDIALFRVGVYINLTVTVYFLPLLLCWQGCHFMILNCLVWKYLKLKFIVFICLCARLALEICLAWLLPYFLFYFLYFYFYYDWVYLIILCHY